MISKAVILMLCISFLGGCAGVNQGRPLRANYQDQIVKTLMDKYSAPDALFANQSSITREQRNQVLDDLTFLTDVNYHKFEAELYQERAFFDSTTDLAIIGLGAAGGLITHSATQAIISAISGGIGGARVSIAKNYFHEFSTQALIAKMQSSRKTKLEYIRKAMTLTVADYSLSRGLSDLAEYYNAGTVVGALQNIVADAGVEAKAADEGLKSLMEGKYAKTAAGDLLRTFWKPDGKTVDKANEQKLIQWLRENELPADSGFIPLLLRSKELESTREKAVQSLKLK